VTFHISPLLFSYFWRQFPSGFTGLRFSDIVSVLRITPQESIASGLEIDFVNCFFRNLAEFFNSFLRNPN
jgi:hypothetical protein